MVSSTSPKEPKTQKRDDFATPGVGESRESGVKEKASDKKDGSSDSLDSKGDLSKSTGNKYATVVDSPGGKGAESVVVAPDGGGEAMVDKDSDGSRTADNSEKVESKSGSESAESTLGTPSVDSSKPTDP